MVYLLKNELSLSNEQYRASTGPTEVVLGVAHCPPPSPRQGTRGAGVALGGNPGLAPTVVAVAAPGGWDPGLAPTVVVAEGRRAKEG